MDTLETSETADAIEATDPKPPSDAERLRAHLLRINQQINGLKVKASEIEAKLRTANDREQQQQLKARREAMQPIQKGYRPRTYVP